MKILAISDVPNWKGYEHIVVKCAPDVVVLCGDLTSDGFAAFWKSAFNLIPAFVNNREQLMRRFGASISDDGVQVIRNLKKYYAYRQSLERLERKYHRTAAFARARRKLHTNPFYRFLRFAGRRAHVLVVKGDHDDDFHGDYSPQRINAIRGCHEISGKTHRAAGFTFLGLGFLETHYRRRLQELRSRIVGDVDVIATHAEQARMPLLAELCPKVIIRGHFGSGRWKVSGVPAVFTADVTYSIVELRRNGRPKLEQFTAEFSKDRDGITAQRVKSGSCRPWFSRKSEFQLYPWLRKFHGPS